jgi:O-antigen/teichoic acid export membrane protein
MIKKFASLLAGTGVENTLTKGSFHAFLIQGTGAALILMTEAIAARLLGITQFGIYAMVSAWIFVLALIVSLGLNHALLRFVPTYLAHEDWGGLRGIIRRSNLWVIIAATLLGTGGSLLLIALQGCCINPAILPAFFIAFVIVPVLALSNLRQAVLRGLGNIAQALAPEWIVRPLAFIALLAAGTALLPLPLQADTALCFNLAATIAAFAIGAYWQHRSLPLHIRTCAPVYRDREWLSVAAPLLLIVGLNLISSRIDILMLGLLSEIEQVGIYSAASRVADVVVFGLISANAIAAPMIARLHSTGRHEELQRMVRLAATGIFLLTMPIALALLIFGHQILGLFGQGFSAGYPVLVILVCGQLVNALAGPVGYLMTMTGHQTKAMKIVGVSAIMNLALNGLLIPIFGMTGAAIATAVSTATWNIMMLRFVHAELSIQSSAIQLFGRRA